MDDLFILGRERNPGPWPRRLALLAVLIVLAVVVITHLPGKRVAPARHLEVRVYVSAGPVQLAGLGSGAAVVLNQAHGVTGLDPPIMSPSPARHSSARRSTPQHRKGLRKARRCPHHPVMRAGNGASPDATGSYCGRGTVG
ncbi:MAG TPA: hypothetical protein VMA72_01850 [Streptosporangiaceae bacterium]|nr:hypothetical protein [Streptosporangiaceae bacterium]